MWPGARWSTDGSHAPARAVGAAQEIVGGGLVGDAKRRGVPEQALLREQGDVAEEDGLGLRAGDVEVGAGGDAAQGDGIRVGTTVDSLMEINRSLSWLSSGVRALITSTL